MPRKLDLPSPEEEDAIQQDPDNPELDDAFFRDARSASAVLPADIYTELTAPQRPGQVGPAGQVQVMLLVDQDVFEGLQAAGPDLQRKINEALRKLVKT